MADAAPLSRVTDFYGNSALVEDDPMCVCHRDVLCVPAGTPNSSHGLFDRGRKMIGAAADHRASPHPHHSLDAYTTLDPETFDHASDEYDYVFLGMLTGHYGHFITASMARLWVVPLARQTRTRYVVLNRPPVDVFFDSEFIASILTAAGVDPSNIVCLDQPTRFRRITVPSPAIEEHNFSHRVFGSLCARIGDLMVPERPPTSDTPVFLSKAILPQGVSRVVNEPELLDHLVRAGVEIVHPETMGMPEKIAMFRSRTAVTGLAGSGMHTAIFAPGRDKLALTFSPFLLSNQLLLDQAGGSTTATYMAESTVEPAAPGWQACFRLADPAATAAAFLALIDTDLRPRVDRRRRAAGTRQVPRTRTIAGFRFRHDNAARLAGFEGWCDMEESQCWTSGPTSFFDLPVAPSEGALTLSLLVGAALARPHLVSRPLVVFAGDTEVARLAISRLTTYTCPLPRRCLENGMLRFRFEHPVTASPRAIGVAPDLRDLSISFEEITVFEAVA